MNCNYTEFLGTVCRATLDGLIEWDIDMHSKSRPLVSEIGTLEHFKAEVEGVCLYLYVYWKLDSRYSHDFNDAFLVFYLEVVAKDSENMMSSDPYCRCEQEPTQFDLLYLYLVVLRNYLKHKKPKIFKRMYRKQKVGESLQSVTPANWDIRDLTDYCA